MDSQTIATFGSEITCSDVTKTLIAKKCSVLCFFPILSEDDPFILWHLYPKFGAAAPRQTGVIARRKKINVHV